MFVVLLETLLSEAMTQQCLRRREAQYTKYKISMKYTGVS
jgi:hypothetical protein